MTTPLNEYAFDKSRTVKQCIDGLAGMAFAIAVRYHGKMNNRQVWEFFHTDENGNVPQDTGIFKRYLAGKTRPRNDRGRNHRHINWIEAVGNQPWGKPALHWLNHDLWKVYAQPPDLIELERIRVGRGVSKDFRDRMVKANYSPRKTDGLHIKKFEDFVFACAIHRWHHLAFSTNKMFELVSNLANEAAAIDPVFASVRPPFMRVLKMHFLYPTSSARGKMVRRRK